MSRREDNWGDSPRQTHSYRRSPSRRSRSPPPRSSNESRAVFVGNLSSSATHEDVKHLFTPYSNVSNIDLKQDFAFVFLENQEAGHEAIRNLDRTTFLDRRIRVEWAKGNGRVKRRGFSREADRRNDAENRPNKTLFVVNFSRNTKDRDLQGVFEPFGKINRVDIRNNYAFVEFDNIEDAKAAKHKLHGTRLDNQVITVEYQAERRNSGYNEKGSFHDSRESYGRDRDSDRYGGSRKGGRSRSPSPRVGRGGYYRSRSRSRDRFGRDRR